uniref:Uncharacterized protein n=1 Tax=Acrobeloides nanus TaxID=290746 RepID=A0A914ERV1_9BILA
MYGKTKHVPLEKQSSPSSTTTSIRESPTTSTRESPTTMSTFTSQRSPHPSPKPSVKNTARNTKKRTTPVRTNKSKTRKDASQGVQSQGPRHWKY